MRLKTIRSIAWLSFVLVILGQVVFAQNTSEEDVKKQAQKYFEAGDFTSALPLYSQLLSFYAKDPVYNYRYGVCALEAGNDREKPIAYLEFASKNSTIDNNVYFYLGKAYHLNYRFSSALNAYNTYKIKATKIDQDKFQVVRQLEMCRNGMELLKNISDLTVMDKKELALTDYFRAYDLSNIGLKLLVKPDDFKTSLDKKKNEESVVVLNPNKSEIYFSSYGENDRNGKDIYKVRRMDNGDWSNPIRLENSINTAFDEDFPFMSNDGTTLYFCSKGHNSMGGYDVFKSTYNPANATWGAPVNMDFAINTPDDDILYISDDVNKVAYFSSRRSSGQGNINVYKIVVGPKPPSIALISGVFSTIDENTHPEATITVRNSDTKAIIGVYKSDPKTGNYSIPLPSSGKYIFNVESEVSAMKTEIVEVPEKKDLGTLQQKISIKNDKLIVENVFEDAAINEANLMALLKAKAKLDVNFVAEATPAVVEQPKTSNLSNQDLVNIAYQDAKDTRAEANQMQLKADQAYAVSKSKMDVSKSKLNSAEVIEKSAQSLSSTQEKAMEMDKVNQMRREAKMNTLQAYAIYSIAKNLEEDAKAKNAEADVALNYAKELDNAIQINSKESIERLTAQKAAIPETNSSKSASDAAAGDLIEQADNKQQEADAAQSRSKIVLTEMLDIDLRAETLTKDRAAAADEKSAQEINNQLEDLKLQKAEKQKQLEQNYALANQLQQEANDLKSQSEFVASAMNDLKSGTNTLPVPSAQEKIMLGNELAVDLGRANTIAKAEPVLKPNNSDINDNAADAFITTEIGKSPVTAENFNSKMAQANKISDPIKREEQKNVVRKQMNSNWEKDIASLKTQQANSKDKNERANMQSRITELENLKAMNSPTPEIALTTAAEKKEEMSMNAAAKKDTSALAVTTQSNDVNEVGNTATNASNQNTSAKNPNSTISSNQTAEPSAEAKTTSADSTNAKTNLTTKEATTLAENSSVTGAANANPTANAETKSDTITSKPVNPNATLANQTATVNQATKTENVAGSENRIDSSGLASNTVKSNEQNQNSSSQKLDSASTSALALNTNTAANDAAPVETSKSGSGTAATNDAQVVNVDKLEEDYDQQYAKVNQITDGAQKSSEMQKLSASWVKSTDEKIASVTAQQATAKNSEDIASLNATLKDLQDLKLKISAVAPSETLAAVNKPTTIASESTPIVKPVNTTSSDNTLAGAALKSNNETKGVYENDFVTEQAKVQARKAERLTAEAAQLKVEEDSLTKVLVTTSDSASKQKVQEQLASTQRGMYVKRIDALKAYSVANNVEFNDNTTQLKRVSESTKSVDNDNVSRAEMLVAEAAYYYNEASIKSELNKSVTDAAVKELEMKKIVELEKTAIEKQRRALTTYGVQPEAYASTQANPIAAATPLNTSTSNGNVNNDETAIEKINPVSSTTPVNTLPQLTASKSSNSDSSVSAKTNTVDQAETARVAKDTTKTQTSSSTLLAQNSSEPSEEMKEERTRAFVYPTDTMVSTIKLDKVEFDSIVSSPYYNYYNGLLVAATENLQQASFYTSRAEKLKVQATNDSLRAEEFIIKASQATDTIQMQNYIGKAAEATFVSNQNKQLSDSSMRAAKGLNMASIQNKGAAAKYIARLSEADKDKLVAVMNNKKPTKEPRTSVTLASTQTAKEIKQDVPKDALVGIPVNSNTEKSNGVAETPASDLAVTTEKQTAQKEVPAEKLIVNNQDLVTPEQSSSTSQLANVVNERNELIREAVFTKVNKAIYSKNNPIPINTTLPSGIIFKVQIGAFRNPIPQDLFKGFDPISGETSATGITRYTAGYFKNFEAANGAKREINTIGYKDAFVVAFCNGKRISIPEATAMIRDGKTCANEFIADAGPLVKAPINTVQDNNAAKKEEPVAESTTLAGNALRNEQLNNEENSAATQQQTTTPIQEVKSTETASSQSNPVQVEEIPSGPVAPSVSFEEVKGLVYTVQVGVYSKPILANQLFNIQPLYFERTPNGLYRYTSGIFDNLEIATQAKANIVGIGVKDAFVTTYFNGARIPVEQAKKMEAEQGKAVFATSSNLNKMPETNSNAKITGLNTAVPTIKIEKQNATANPTQGKIALPVEGLKNQANNDIVFKVQIGVFRSEVPLEIAAIFLKLSSRGIDHYQTSDSLTIYTIGNLRDINSANSLKDEVIQEGLPDAFVVAFKAGNKMKIEDAIKEVNRK
ncbi:MAG: PD40 domain-containing protein [Bacteroidetes bacterium]|nr:PD40 domain-containing protein [Bacteroidota bacterium]